ncbi:MAG: glycosyltransferase [Sphingomicrobium sp.]
MTRISIALATYNGVPFLQEQLDSYRSQERLPDELVVGDDGSTDGTRAILERFAKAAPFPVKLLDGPSSGGIAANFERVIRACSGDLILLSDQDDIWFASKIATVELAMAGAPDILALHHDEWLMDSATGERLPLTFNQRARRSGIWEHLLYVGNCTAMRNRLLPIVLPIPGAFGFDEWLSLVPEALGARLVIEQQLQLWRRHAANSSTAAIAEAQPPTALEIARRFGVGDPRTGWSIERDKLRLAAHRIAETSALVDAALGPGRAAKAIGSLEQTMARIERRSARLAIPRWRRWASVLTGLIRGEYASFSGWRSAAKDAIRAP